MDTLAMHARRFGIVRPVNWETNRVPNAQEQMVISQGPRQMPEILRALKLAYESLLPHAFKLVTSDDDLRASLLLLREFMRRNGMDPDPDHLVATVARYLAAKNETNGHQGAPPNAGSSGAPPASLS